MEDSVLLGRYVATGCQESFQRIVTRHSGWVFSVALRAVRDRHLAEDVTQAVFIILARKASAIREGTPLSGWLFKVSRFAISDALKRRARIKNRENRFAEYFKASSGAGAVDGESISDGISQELDEAVACLSESDRQAVLLRFYEHKSLAELGTILGISEEAAKKRVARAVARLRKYFSARGIGVTMALLLLLLSGRTAEAAGMPAIGVAAAELSIGNAIAKGAMELMAKAQARLLGAILAAGFALLIAVPTLGGALVRSIVTPASPRGMATEVVPVPPEKLETEGGKERHLPAEPRFADLWIEYKGQLLWQSNVYAPPAAPPYRLVDAEKRSRPYAVALDPAGNYFIRPLDHSILQSPAIRQGLLDYDAGPLEAPARVENMLSTLEMLPAVALRPAHSSSHGEHGEKLSILPDPGSDKASGQDWHQLQQEPAEDGTMLVRGAGFLQLNNDGGLNMGIGDSPGLVPEPSGAIVALGVAVGTLARRRRRRG